MLFTKKKKMKDFLPPAVTVEHGEYSMILSSHDENAFPTDTLIETSLQAISAARSIDLADLSKRLFFPPYYPNIWPGEHYKLLCGFVEFLKPKIVIEIGTATGLSSLAMKKTLKKDSQIITFDLFSWEDDKNTVLEKKDFEDKRLIQYVDDISQQPTFNKYTSLLKESTMIFIDATHDGVLEKILLDKLSTIEFLNTCYIIFDDIRVWTMLKMWREITFPKLDLTSFGHWSGTGIIEICKKKKS